MCVSACVRVSSLRLTPTCNTTGRETGCLTDPTGRCWARSVKAGHGSGRDRFPGGGNRPPAFAVGPGRGPADPSVTVAAAAAAAVSPVCRLTSARGSQSQPLFAAK